MNEDEIIEQMSRLTHSPRGKYAVSEETYQELLARLPEGDRPVTEPTGKPATGPAIVRRLWWRTRAAASVAVIMGISVAIACVVTFGGRFFAPTATESQPTEAAPALAVQTLVFDNEPLSGIVAALSKAYGADIVVEDSALADYRLTATFTTDESLDEVLSILAEAGSFKVGKDGARFVLTPAGRTAGPRAR